MTFKKIDMDIRKSNFICRTKNINGCWIWQGPIFKDGYGNCGAPYSDQRAHRASFKLFKGEIPGKLCVLHKCDTPLCVNPDHLYVGDVKQNVKDALERGQFPRGKNPKKGLPGMKNGRHKLIEKDIPEIRKLYSEGMSSKDIGKIFNVEKSTILHCVHRRTWCEF